MYLTPKYAPNIEEALQIVWDSLDHYRKDCLGYEGHEPEYVEIGNAMNLVEQTLTEYLKEKES